MWVREACSVRRLVKAERRRWWVGGVVVAVLLFSSVSLLSLSLVRSLDDMVANTLREVGLMCRALVSTLR